MRFTILLLVISFLADCTESAAVKRTIYRTGEKVIIPAGLIAGGVYLWDKARKGGRFERFSRGRSRTPANPGTGQTPDPPSYPAPVPVQHATPYAAHEMEVNIGTDIKPHIIDLRDYASNEPLSSLDPEVLDRHRRNGQLVGEVRNGKVRKLIAPDDEGLIRLHEIASYPGKFGLVHGIVGGNIERGNKLMGILDEVGRLSKEPAVF